MKSKEWSWLYIVTGSATPDSNAANSNVQNSISKMSPQAPCSTAAVDRPVRQPNGNMQGTAAAQYSSTDDWRATMNANHDAALGWRPAAWTLNTTRDTRKELKKAEYNVITGKAAARVLVEHQEAMNAALAAYYQLHNPNQR